MCCGCNLSQSGRREVVWYRQSPTHILPLRGEFTTNTSSTRKQQTPHLINNIMFCCLVGMSLTIKQLLLCRKDKQAKHKTDQKQKQTVGVKGSGHYW